MLGVALGLRVAYAWLATGPHALPYGDSVDYDAHDGTGSHVYKSKTTNTGSTPNDHPSDWAEQTGGYTGAEGELITWRRRLP